MKNDENIHMTVNNWISSTGTNIQCVVEAESLDTIIEVISQCTIGIL